MNITVKWLLWLSFILFLYFTVQIVWPNWNEVFPPVLNAIKITYDGNSKISSYGTLLAGLFSFVSVILIYFTLKQQSEAFNLNQFEARVFELIRHHRDNVASMKMKAPNSFEGKYYDGHKAVREIHKHILDVFERTTKYAKNFNLDSDIYIDKALQSKEQNLIKGKAVDGKKFVCLNLAYLIVFHGVNLEGRHSLYQRLQKKYKKSFYHPFVMELSREFAYWDRDNLLDDFKELFRDRGNRKQVKIVFYGGHQYRLGHYFRHLFQTINYIDNNKHLSYDEKYKYVSLLRAQLSSFEQSILFFNSISDTGRRWELEIHEPRIKSWFCKDGKRKLYVKNKALITKYDLVRNIPNEFIHNIRIDELYPNVIFDGNEEKNNKVRLELNKSFRKPYPKNESY